MGCKVNVWSGISNTMCWKVLLIHFRQPRMSMLKISSFSAAVNLAGEILIDYNISTRVPGQSMVPERLNSSRHKSASYTKTFQSEPITKHESVEYHTTAIALYNGTNGKFTRVERGINISVSESPMISDRDILASVSVLLIAFSEPFTKFCSVATEGKEHNLLSFHS